MPNQAPVLMEPAAQRAAQTSKSVHLKNVLMIESVLQAENSLLAIVMNANSVIGLLHLPNSKAGNNEFPQSSIPPVPSLAQT